MNAPTLIQKLWNYCSVLCYDGMSYGDYVEQLTYLLFLKMADERNRPPYHQPIPIPARYAWQVHEEVVGHRRAYYCEGIAATLSRQLAAECDRAFEERNRRLKVQFTEFPDRKYGAEV